MVTPHLRSLKISCKSVQPFSRNVADKEISIAASRGFSELTQNVMWSFRGHSTASLKISCKSVQPFCQNKPFSRNVADKEISIEASRGFSELTQNVIRWSHGHSTLSLKFRTNRSSHFARISRFVVMLLTKKLVSRHRAVSPN